MERLLVPHLNLVDSSGNLIGALTDDPNSWNTPKLHISIDNPTSNKQVSDNDNYSSSSEKEFEISKNQSKRDNSAISFNTKSQSVTIKSNKKRPLINLKQNSGLTSNVWYTSYEENLNECKVIGETPLHIAIIYDDLNTVKYLIEYKGFSVNACSCKPTKNSEIETKSLSANNTQYENSAYFGEFPLAFAACFGNRKIYDYLIDKGADPNLQDSYGNTILHILVINDKLVKYGMFP